MGGGVSALCEYIRSNTNQAPIQELHLSHNELCDDDVLELLRAMHERKPHYPPRRVVDKSGELVPVPVWLQLNQNQILDPPRVLQTAKEEGITVCEAWDRQACGTSRCRASRNGATPLVHLFNFGAQRKADQISDRVEHHEKHRGHHREHRGQNSREHRSGDRDRDSRRRGGYDGRGPDSRGYEGRGTAWAGWNPQGYSSAQHGRP